MGDNFIPFNKHRLDGLRIQFEYHRLRYCIVLGMYDGSPIRLTLRKRCKALFNYKLEENGILGVKRKADRC